MQFSTIFAQQPGTRRQGAVEPLLRSGLGLPPRTADATKTKSTLKTFPLRNRLFSILSYWVYDAVAVSNSNHFNHEVNEISLWDTE